MIFLLLSTHKDLTTLEWPKEVLFYNEKLSEILAEKWVDFIRSSSFEYDCVKKIFKKGQIVKAGKWEDISNFQPDVILCYSNTVNDNLIEISKVFPFKNEIWLISLANDKLKTAQYFYEYSPVTYNLLHEGLIRDKEYIIKPNWGTGWNNIKKIKWYELLDYVLKKDYIIQEILDLSVGIEWIVNGIHDVRFIVFGGVFFSESIY